MKDNRMTIRLTKQLEKRIQNIMKKGKHMKKSELIREALWFGLNHIENKEWKEKLEEMGQQK